MQITSGKSKFNVVDSGQGSPALVFLHYWGGSARTWQQVTDELGNSYRCIAYDQRGWGKHHVSEAEYSLEDLATDALDLITLLNLNDYVLVGHSMGGKAAQLLASRQPAGLRALVLVAPASPSPQHIPAEALDAQKHAYDNQENALAAIDFLTVRRPGPDAVNQLIDDSHAGSAGAKKSWPDKIAYEDISGQVGKISVPTMVVVGDHDRQDPEEQQRQEVLPLISGAKLEVIVDCGHLIPIDQPVQLAKLIRSFLSRTALQQ